MEQGIIRGNYIPSVSHPFGFSLANSGDKSIVAGSSGYLPAPPDFFALLLALQRAQRY
jgi:hypothetical protein